MTSSSYLILSSIIFSIGFLESLYKQKKYNINFDVNRTMLLATNINFVGFSNTLDDLFGQIFALFILVVAAEAAIGLAILTIFFKKSGSISIDTINKLKG